MITFSVPEIASTYIERPSPKRNVFPSIVGDASQVARPLLRWAGSKRRLLPRLMKHLPQYFTRYIEPFCGSAALYFELLPKKAILSDINGELINFYLMLRSGLDIYSYLSSIDISQEEYYYQRKKKPESMTPEERAIRFIYLNRLCFNGVYRTNKEGQFNVPFGSRMGEFPPRVAFERVRHLISDVTFLNVDYKNTLSLSKRNDFVYLDPPYFKRDRYGGEYGPGAFTAESRAELGTELRTLDRKGVKFLLSFKADDILINTLHKNFDVEVIDIRRHVAGFKEGWTVESEILAWNYVKS